MKSKLEFFANDYYRVLKCLKDRAICVKDITYTKLSQQEIGDILQISKAKANTIIGILKKQGYIEVIKRGQYLVTEKGLRVLYAFSSV